MKKHNIAFGKALRELRQKNNLSQEVLAFEAGLSRNFIALLEAGQRSPTLNTIVTICNALNISLIQLASLVEENMAGLDD